MTNQQEITQFLNEWIRWPRMANPAFGTWATPNGFQPQQRPTVEQLANELLGIGEYRALQVGTWLGTTDGEIITQAVEAMSPPLYRQDVELLVAALKLAAVMQQTEGQQRAGKFALGAIGVAAIIAIGFGGLGGSRGA